MVKHRLNEMTIYLLFSVGNLIRKTSNAKDTISITPAINQALCPQRTSRMTFRFDMTILNIKFK